MVVLAIYALQVPARASGILQLETNGIPPSLSTMHAIILAIWLAFGQGNQFAANDITTLRDELDSSCAPPQKGPCSVRHYSR